MSIYEFFHYSLFPGLFVAFTYNKKEPPVFGAAPAFWCILLSFLGLSFRHIPNNLSNYNVLTANAPFFYQISGTWSNHEGSILSWCRILSFYGFLLCYCYPLRPYKLGDAFCFPKVNPWFFPFLFSLDRSRLLISESK